MGNSLFQKCFQMIYATEATNVFCTREIVKILTIQLICSIRIFFREFNNNFPEGHKTFEINVANGINCSESVFQTRLCLSELSKYSIEMIYPGSESGVRVL